MSQYDKIQKLQAQNRAAQVALQGAVLALRQAQTDIAAFERLKVEYESLHNANSLQADTQRDLLLFVGKLMEHTTPEFLDDDVIQFDPEEKEALYVMHHAYLQTVTQKPVDNVG